MERKILNANNNQNSKQKSQKMKKVSIIKQNSYQGIQSRSIQNFQNTKKNQFQFSLQQCCCFNKKESGRERLLPIYFQLSKTTVICLQLMQKNNDGQITTAGVNTVFTLQLIPSQTSTASKSRTVANSASALGGTMIISSFSDSILSF
eukprot:EC096139.1.p1 GENE.EC096139.1~~EC096139.1.p1  ORF type:complete len:148 (-),score=15.82 EC096139.1:132-575(-)